MELQLPADKFGSDLGWHRQFYPAHIPHFPHFPDPGYFDPDPGNTRGRSRISIEIPPELKHMAALDSAGRDELVDVLEWGGVTNCQPSF